MKSQMVLTGISDFHALTLTIMRNALCKGNPKTKFYRDFKNLDCEMFESELSYSLQSFQLLDYTRFRNVFLLLLNNYAPIKKKILRANHSLFMTKTLRKAIMLRSQLKNKFVKSRNNEDWSNYKNQRNFCKNLLKKSKQNYFGQLDMKHLNDNRKFWNIIKHFFSDKGLNSHKKMIIEDHASVKIIRQKNKDNEEFRFQPILTEEPKKIIIDLDCNKSKLNGSIPANVLKDTCDTFILYLTEIINNSFQTGNFPSELKLVEVTPVFKKKERLNKENYRLVSVLSHVPKNFEKIV